MTARIVRVNGPLVEIDGAGSASMGELVVLGDERIAAEVIAINGECAVLQAYEYSGGLAVNDSADLSGQLLSGLFGPGLLGNAFDGLMRPLSSASQWLGADRPPATNDAGLLDRRWRFVASVSAGDTVTPGIILGTVPDSGSVEHRVLVPEDRAGTVDWIADGEITAREIVAKIAGHDVRLAEPWPLRRPRSFEERLVDAVPLRTGQRVLDLLYPVAKGTAGAVPGGFGTGKTMLLQQIAKWSDADVIVYVGCGERGNEMADVLEGLAELTDARTGGRLIDRTVLIANTSNMPMMAREASIFTGVAIAEYYRDMGYDTVVIADSTSRWAEALREFANRNGDLPAEEGYPASLSSALARFYERAARVRTLGSRDAAVTIIGAVSPPGGDLTEPVTTNTERFVRSLWLLDRDLAYSRHYPAVSWRGSYAQDADDVARWFTDHGDPRWAQRRAEAESMLAEADRLAGLAEIVGASALPGRERMILLGGRLLRDGVLMQNALADNDAYCTVEKGAALLDFVLDVITTCKRLIESGAPATALEEWDYSPLVRAREDFAPDDAAGVRALAAQFLASLEKGASA